MVASTAITNDAPSEDQAYVRPLPYLVPRSIIQKAAHFSEAYWKLDSDSIIFKILDALCGDAGAGNDKKALFISRLQTSLDSTYFQDLDSFYFGVLGFPRHLSESYDYNPYNNVLTGDQWTDVLVKDAKYRARCLDLMSALNHGGSPFGFRMACKAVLGVDCDIFELFKYMDSPAYRSGLMSNGGFASTPSVVFNDFEDGLLTGWVGTSATVASTNSQANRGSRSALLTVTGSPVQSYARKNVPVVAGTSYTLSIWVRSTPGYADVSCGVDWYDINHGYLSSNGSGGSALAATTWASRAVTATAPVGAAFADYGPTLGTNPPNGTALFFDDVSFAASPSATFNLTSGFSLNVKIRSDLFSTGTTPFIIGKWNNTGNQRSWGLRINATGFPQIVSSNDGTAVVTTTSTAALPTSLQTKDFWLSASFNPNNGANRVANFRYSLDGTNWTTLGTTVTSTTTTIFTSTSVVTAGAQADEGLSFGGWIYRANIYSDVAWTTLIDTVNFTGNGSGTTSFTDSSGFVWALASPATMLPNYALGKTGTNLRTEVLITPHKTITRQERRNLELVLDRLKPREAVLTIAAGLQVNLQTGIHLVSADSSYFETDIKVTGASGISNAASGNFFSALSNDQTIYYLRDGVQTRARTPAFTTGQESYENYDFSPESISTIDSIEYESVTNINADPLTRTVEGEHLVQNSFDIRFGPWTDFDLADSPDNFPGGKYGQSPRVAPALNQNGSAYQFRYASQAAYVAGQTAVVVAAGGEANSTQYRVRLAQASVSARVSDPFDCLSQNVGVSVQSTWFESR